MMPKEARVHEPLPASLDSGDVRQSAKNAPEATSPPEWRIVASILFPVNVPAPINYGPCHANPDNSNRLLLGDRIP